MRVLYLETAVNLELFRVISDSEGIRSLSADDPRLIWIIRNLSTKAIELLIIGDSEIFAAVRNMKEPEPDELNPESGGYHPQNNSQRLRYLSIQIAFLRCLVAENGQTFKHAIRPELRMERVKKQLLEIKKSLREQRQVKNFMRT